MPSSKNGVSLYDKLGVPSDASPDNIKRAYHKLALQYHPDKNPGHESEFQEIGAAYQILSDTKTRNIYDRYGDFGIQLLSNVKSATLVDFILNTNRLKLLYCIALLVLLLASTFPLLCAFKISKYIVWRWWRIFSPLWLFDVVCLFGGVSLLYLSWKSISSEENHEDEEFNSTKEATDLNRNAFIVSSVLLLMVFGFLILQKLFLALKLDGIVGWSWWIILSPYLIIDSLNIFWISASVFFILLRWESSLELVNEETKACKFPKLFYIFSMLRWGVIRFSFMILLILKITKFPRLSYFIVFGPIYFLLPLSTYINYRVDLLQARREMASYTIESGPAPTLILTLKYVPFLIFYFLLICLAALYHAHTVYPNVVGWKLAFSPVYLTFGITFLLILVGGIFGFMLIPNFNDIASEMPPSPTASTTTTMTATDDSLIVKNELDLLKRVGTIYGPSHKRLTSPIE